MKKITFCKQNFELGTNVVMEKLIEMNLKNYEIRTTRCLGECGDCFTSCIADFHGKLLVEENPELLLNKILQLISEDDIQ
ncbi:DUF1450 domain-containing protein [Clostridium sp. 'deep sea']|uniref:DUF1450 domain-containing protein n=1 Tax=Clostridium sp. 'deep sea' TaxID=2779445 RepID=UPI001896A218|nr:DUF1450 domain-containing protein [Clostridium sp. 'deep sea']QOR35641.1 DUF1450 domain-containing protein [Clostridium sp. 'deep sea']